MPQPLEEALAEIRAALLDRSGLRRAIAAGHRRGAAPSWVRAELRPVALKRGEQLQVVTSDGVRPVTRNVPWGGEAEATVDALLAEPFGNWHVETDEATWQLRVTKRGEAALHRSAPPVDGGDAAADERLPDAAPTSSAAAAHDRAAQHLLDPGDPLFDLIGGTAAKRRQVDAFLRALDSTVDTPVSRIVDLGCGNAYLTFAAYRYFASRGTDVEIVGVDVREDQRERNTELARQLGCGDRVRFVAGAIRDVDVEPNPDAVFALHACDTATDEALARAVRWGAKVVLAAPCCHHDIAAQLRRGPVADPYQMITRQPILRERFADVLTDALRASLLRLHGYRVDVVEFVESRHTPRNVLLRARHTGAPPTREQRAEYAELVGAWGITPALATLLDY
jgi:SAM-dependent methyltransferase